MAIQTHKQSEVEYETRGMAEWISLYELYNAVFKAGELALLPHNVSLPQVEVLSVLRRNGGTLSIGDIARAMVRSSQTITGVVDRLEAQSLVERERDRRDRRKIWVRLTAKGQRKGEQVTPVANRLVEEIFSVLTDKELRDLLAKTDRLRTVAMERLAEALGRSGFDVPPARS